MRLKLKPLNPGIDYKVVIVCIIFYVLFVFRGSFAVLYQETDSLHTLFSSNIAVDADVYFMNDSGEKRDVPVDVERDNGYFKVKMNKKQESELCVDINFNAVTKSYIRVYIGDMWVVNDDPDDPDSRDTAIFKEDTLFNLYQKTVQMSPAPTDSGEDESFEPESTPLWYDNRLYDNYFYYIGDNGYGSGIIRTKKDETITLPFIRGLQEITPIDNGVIYLEIRVESVQFNRVDQFWGPGTPPVILEEAG